MSELLDGCTCHPVYLNSQEWSAHVASVAPMARNDVVGYNWEETCPNHGLKSEWYRTEGKPQFDADKERLRDLQAKARQSRKDWESRENRCQDVLIACAGSWYESARCEKDTEHEGKHLSQFAGREW